MGFFDEAKKIEAEEIIRQIEEAWDREEKYWWQRSRVKWLSDGDRNTRFFHASTVQRRARNKVSKLMDGEGRWLVEEKDIQSAFSSFYGNLFRVGSVVGVDKVLSFMERCIGDEECLALEGMVTEEEIKGAVYQLNGMKAPGPDGFSGLFYHVAWGEVKWEVVEMVKDFFQKGTSLSPINATNVVLLPKVDQAERVDQFRSIGLCNFVYKVISKILANRLKPVMVRVISEQQRAFVAGRLIQDNILVAHEAFHYLKNKKKGGKVEMAVKIDMKKAYDRLEWRFIEGVMRRMGFEERWIAWVMECVSSTSLNLIVGGKKVADLGMSRGIKQGDPLSPYIFIMAADVLSKMVKWHVDNGKLRGVRLARECPVLSHCFFADDALFFVNARKQNCRMLKKLLDWYCGASG